MPMCTLDAVVRTYFTMSPPPPPDHEQFNLRRDTGQIPTGVSLMTPVSTPPHC